MNKSTTPISKIEQFGVYDIEKAASSLAVSKRTLQQYIREKKVLATKVGKEYRITGDSLLHFLGTPSLSNINMSEIHPLTDKK